MYPSNQRTWSNFVVDKSGEVVEYVTYDGENFFLNEVDQNNYRIDWLE